MATNPYIEKNPGDLIKAEDWNEIQIQTREEIQSLHDHTGDEKGLKISSEGIADGSIKTAHLQGGAVTGEKIAPLSIRDELVSAEAAIAESKIAFDSERLRITDEGNVGIGTAEPQSKLAVSGGVAIGSSYAGANAAPDNGLLVEGNVGIGTTSPGQKLSVVGNVALTDQAGIPTSLTSDRSITYYDNNGVTESAKVLFFQPSSPGHGNEPGNISFHTRAHDNEGGGSITERMRITSSGNIGIGWTSPSSKLDIHQDAFGTDKGLRIRNVVGTAYWDLAIAADPYDRFDITNSAHGNVMTLRNDGNVGIGTTNPQNKLHTAGTSYADNRKGGAIDYAEYFESLDGVEILVGTSVVLDGDKIRPTKKNETPIGVISANPLIVGGVPMEWPKKYLRDEFGNLIMDEYQEEIRVPKTEKVTRERQKVEKQNIEEEVTRTEIVLENGKYCQKEVTETITREVEEPVFEEVDLYDAAGENVIGGHQIPVMETYEEEIEVTDENGQPVLVGSGEFVTEERPKLNPEYDESREYVSREERPEWNCVGLLGQLPLRKGQPVAESWIKIQDISDEVELWLVK